MLKKLLLLSIIKVNFFLLRLIVIFPQIAMWRLVFGQNDIKIDFFSMYISLRLNGVSLWKGIYL